MPWAAYGTFSSIEIFTNPEGIKFRPTEFDPMPLEAHHFKGQKNAGAIQKFRLATMLHGVDFSSHPGGVISWTHGEAELEDTANALRQAARMLKAEVRFRPGQRRSPLFRHPGLRRDDAFG